MKPIAVFDSATDGESPRFLDRMPRGPQRWLVKITGEGPNGASSIELRPRDKCLYGELMRQHMQPAIEELRSEVGGAKRMAFWVYRAR